MILLEESYIEANDFDELSNLAIHQSSHAQSTLEAAPVVSSQPQRCTLYGKIFLILMSLGVGAYFVTYYFR